MLPMILYLSEALIKLANFSGASYLGADSTIYCVPHIVLDIFKEFVYHTRVGDMANPQNLATRSRNLDESLASLY